MVMTLITNTLTAALIIAAAFTLMFMLWKLANDTANTLERAIRIMAFGAGLLTVLGAKAAGVSISDFMVSSLKQSNPVLIGIFGVALPVGTGVLVAWYMKTRMEKGNDFGKRIMVFVGVLVTTQFTELYAAVVHVNGFAPSRSLLPNVAFIVGLVLYIITQYDTAAIMAKAERRGGLRQAAVDYALDARRSKRDDHAA
jgi:hypothetical protein